MMYEPLTDEVWGKNTINLGDNDSNSDGSNEADNDKFGITRTLYADMWNTCLY
jgi:hypothetical protein